MFHSVLLEAVIESVDNPIGNTMGLSYGVVGVGRRYYENLISSTLLDF